MKNKIKYYIIGFLINILLTFNIGAFEQFEFNVTEIEILENGNKIKGLNRGKISSNDGVVITADTFVYNKTLNQLIANGNVKIEDNLTNYIIFANDILYFKKEEKIKATGKVKIIDDKKQTITSDKIEFNKKLNQINAKGNVKIENKINKYIVFAEDISYLKNKEKILTKGKSQAIIEKKYNIYSEDIEFDTSEKKIKSNKKTKIINNNNQVINLDKFYFSINENEIRGENILLVTDFGSPKSDKFFFSSAILNLNKNSFIAKNTEIKIHKTIFDNSENDPRIKGVSAKGNDDQVTLNKAVFTTCKQNDNCPPWSLSAKKIKHEKNKKQITYDSAILKIYDLPVMYFPKFFHPDPSVKRQSGLLQPKLNNSNILGNSFTLPYYNVISKNKDSTIFISLFDKGTAMVQNEYRQVGKNSSLVADLGFTRNYKPLDSKNKNVIHLFSTFKHDLGLSEYKSSKLKLNIERVNNDTYMKVFDSVIEKTDAKPKNTDLLTNQFLIELDHENYEFSSGFNIYEDLNKNTSDRYQYVLPFYNYTTNISNNFLNGITTFSSNGSNDLNNTNNLKSKIVNDLNYTGKNFITNYGFKNNFSISIKNLNSVGKKDSEYKSSPQVELMGVLDINTSLPFVNDEEDYIKFLTPKLKLKLNPNDMKNYFNTDRKMNAATLFNSNRLGLSDTLETGKSLTLGLDYKKQDKNDLNKSFEVKLATMFRDKEEKFIPANSTLGKKNSNLFGTLSNNFNEFINLKYDFAIDNNYKEFEYNNINTSISVNNFITKFDFIEESGLMGASNIFQNETSYIVDEKNMFSFKTRRNRKLNLTEYYDLIYQYNNDCLSASIKYKKSYYEDRALKPSEDIFFSLTLFPLTTYEQKVNN